MTHAVNLFSGAGGWEQGALGLPLELYGLDNAPAAVATAVAAGHQATCIDVTRVPPCYFAGVGGVVASPPCPTFSVMGKQSGNRDWPLVVAAVEATAAGRHVLVSDFEDPRTALVVEPLRWVLELDPKWFAFEQVVPVLPVWNLQASVLRRAGYSVVTGVLKSEDYWVGQTRRRAIMVGARRRVALPIGTCSEPMSMADVIGWGTTHRPAMTVTGGGSGTGGAEPFSMNARRFMRREWEARRWVGPEFVRQRPTPVEVGLLQSFPADYPWQGNQGQRYMQAGNAIPPLMARAILAQLV